MSQMSQDLALLAPVLAVLLTAVGALSFEMLHQPKISLPFAVIGLVAMAAFVRRDSGERIR